MHCTSGIWRLGLGSGSRTKSPGRVPAMRDGSQGADEGTWDQRVPDGAVRGEAVDRGACELLLSVVIGNFPDRGVGCWEWGRENSKSWGAYVQPQQQLFAGGGQRADSSQQGWDKNLSVSGVHRARGRGGDGGRCGSVLRDQKSVSIMSTSTRGRLVCDEGRKKQRHKVGAGSTSGGLAVRHWSVSFGSSQGLGARPTGTVEITGPAPSNVGPSNRTSNTEAQTKHRLLLHHGGPPCFAIFQHHHQQCLFSCYGHRDVRPDCGSSRFPSSRRQLSDPVNPRNPRNPSSPWDCHFQALLDAQISSVDCNLVVILSCCPQHESHASVLGRDAPPGPARGEIRPSGNSLPRFFCRDRDAVRCAKGPVRPVEPQRWPTASTAYLHQSLPFVSAGSTLGRHLLSIAPVCRRLDISPPKRHSVGDGGVLSLA